MGEGGGRLARETLVARSHLAAGLAGVLAGVAWLGFAGPSANAILAAEPLLVLGGFAVIVFGTSRLLLAGMAGRALVGPPWLAAALLALALLGALGAFAATSGTWERARPLVLAWSAGMALHVAIVAASARRARLPGAPSRRMRGGEERLVQLLEWGSLAYALAAAVAIPAALFWGSVPQAAAYHVVLTGFVTLTIVSVLARVLRRFTGVSLAVPALAVVAFPLLTGPALLASGLIVSGPLFVAGAAVEAVGLATFALCVLVALARSPRERRLAFAAYALGALAILAGATVGVLFALAPATRALAPVHGALNVLGFIGFFVVGCSTEFYGPGIARGSRALALGVGTTLVLAASGLVLATGGVVAGGGATAWRAGLLLYAAGLTVHVAGALASLARERRRYRAAVERSDARTA